MFWSVLKKQKFYYCKAELCPQSTDKLSKKKPRAFTKFRQIKAKHKNQNSNSREILDSNHDKLLLQNGIQSRRKTKQKTWRVFQLVPKHESGVWLLHIKKSERKMKTMILSLNLLLFFFKKRVNMIDLLTAGPSKVNRDSIVKGFSLSRYNKQLTFFNFKHPEISFQGTKRALINV